ncbi:MAG: suppressor of fused domain protein [Chloroflexi bacterium]|nr:suppressor of fused domain protein [Chloroflexota bacterium]
MDSTIEHYLDLLNALTGRQPEYHLITEKHERPPVWTIIYRRFPGQGSLTAFTYGLSSIDYPEWRSGRPELIISVDSNNIDWGLAIGYLARTMRGQHSFSYGSIIDFGGIIAGDSAMTGFFVFAPTVLSLEEAAIQLPDRTINLVQLYPIYREEYGLIEEMGTPDFFFREDVNLRDVNRPVVKK